MTSPLVMSTQNMVPYTPREQDNKHLINLYFLRIYNLIRYLLSQTYPRVRNKFTDTENYKQNLLTGKLTGTGNRQVCF